MNQVLAMLLRAVRGARVAPPRPASPFIRVSQGRGFNLRYLVYWETTPYAILVHFDEGSYFMVEGEEGGHLLRMLNAMAGDPTEWARGNPASDGKH